jgi:5-methylcytosine-specific restriction enzyme A
MKIRDLSAPVTASKSDWLAGTTWIGFTPTDGGLTARNKCQSTIRRQFGSGYVIEYITEKFGEPNPGFENDPTYLSEREGHKELAGRFIAVHKLRETARSLEEILGEAEFRLLQDMWAQHGNRNRWSVAFPIIESYRIAGFPKAKTVLGQEAYERLYAHSSGTLRPLNDQERASIAELVIERIPALNAWIGIEDEFPRAERSPINAHVRRLIEHDMSDEALEGVPVERRIRLRTRAAWKAEEFLKGRLKAHTLRCDNCGFDPSTVVDPSIIRLRSLLDVHHKCPLEEGVRYTNVADFELLCPTCHRVAHAILSAKGRGLIERDGNRLTGPSTAGVGRLAAE